MDDLTLIKNRFNDLAERSYKKNIWVYSDFLSLGDQSELLKLKLSAKVSLFGGFDGEERQIAIFGDENELGYEPSPPVTFIEINPLNKKFADDLTHRDFLGSLMALGIKRETLGDIIINENTAVIVCLQSISDYIISQLTSVKHTSVKCNICGCMPENVLPELRECEYITASDRLDVILSAVYNLSRSECQNLFAAQKVFLNSRITENTSERPNNGDMISLRGYGRLIYCGIIRTTKKGRNVISVKIY